MSDTYPELPDPNFVTYRTNEEWETNLRENYWDLSKIFETASGYNDFEGFATGEYAASIVQNPTVQEHIESAREEHGEYVVDNRKLVRDMLIHYVYGNQDEGDYLVSVEEACVFVDNLCWMVTSRYWMKVKDEDLAVKPKE